MSNSKKDMAILLAKLADHLSVQSADHTALPGVIAVLRAAADDPGKAIKAPKAKAEAKPRSQRSPVEITYTGSEILVGGLSKAGINFWKVKFALDRIQGVETGKTVEKPGEYFGQPVYKSTYDRKTKGNRLPLSCKAAMLAFFASEGITVSQS